jgi:hypothetical protein
LIHRGNSRHESKYQRDNTYNTLAPHYSNNNFSHGVNSSYESRKVSDIVVQKKGDQSTNWNSDNSNSSKKVTENSSIRKEDQNNNTITTASIWTSADCDRSQKPNTGAPKESKEESVENHTIVGYPPDVKDMEFYDSDFETGINIHQKKKIGKKYFKYNAITNSSNSIFQELYHELQKFKKYVKGGQQGNEYYVWTEMGHNNLLYIVTPTVIKFTNYCYEQILKNSKLVTTFPFALEESRMENSVSALTFNFNIPYVEGYDYSVSVDDVIMYLKQTIIELIPNANLSKIPILVAENKRSGVVNKKLLFETGDKYHGIRVVIPIGYTFNSKNSPVMQVIASRFYTKLPDNIKWYLGKPAGKENILDVAGCYFKKWRKLLSIKMEKCKDKYHSFTPECPNCRLYQYSYVPYGIYQFNSDSMQYVDHSKLEYFITYYTSFFFEKPDIIIQNQDVLLDKFKSTPTIYGCHHKDHARLPFQTLQKLREHELTKQHLSEFSQQKTFHFSSDWRRWEKNITKGMN